MSEFIEVSGSTKYTMSSTLISGQTAGQIQINEFDENKNYNSATFLNVTTLEFTTKSNTKYLRVGYRIDRQENVMLEQGSKTSYEPYVEPQIYIKNSNDVYEEFIKKDEETYLITNEAEHDGTSYYSLKRKENLVIFSFNALRIKNITQNTWFKICEIPNSIKPNANFVPVILSGVINMGTGNIVGLAKLELRQDGGVYIKPNITYSDVGIFGTVSWFI